MTSKAGRNDPCPCGSGKKFKQCCQGKAATAAQAPVAIAALMRDAISHHRAGRFAEAELLYQQVLQAAPDHPDALHLLGVLASQVGMHDVALDLISHAINVHPTSLMHFNLGNAHKALGRLDGAVASYRAALAMQPDYPDACRNLGIALQAGGQYADAIAAFRQAIALAPAYAEVYANMGAALREQGRADEAMNSYRRAISLKPGLAEAHTNLGVLLKEQGQLRDALDSHQRATLVQPDYAEAHNNLGNALLDAGEYERAAASLERAVQLQPGLAGAYNNLGNAYKALGRLAEALASYSQAIGLAPQFAMPHNNCGAVLAQQGRLEEAVGHYRAALRLEPAYAEALYNLANAHKDLGQFEEALAGYRQTLALRPNYAEAHSNLGNVQKARYQLAQAEASYRQALALQPGLAVTHSNLGTVLQDQGRLLEAIASFEKALALKPDYFEARSNLLLALCLDSTLFHHRYAREAAHFGALAATVAKPFTAWHTANRAGRRLRVGLVSGDLRAHPVGFFLDGVLGHLDRTAIELVAYTTQPQEDAMSARLKSHFDAWHCIAALGDAQAAQAIHGAGIDVLVDLAGHTAHNRLPMLAWKPAPVQLSWLGYFASTGMPGIDYLLADAVSVPQVHAEVFSETLLRLPETRLCFTVPAGAPPVAPLPALARGAITFGCFQNLAKVNDAVLAAWARIFAALPTARLVLQCRQMDCPVTRAALLERLAGAGIAGARVTVHGYMERSAYLAAHHEIDMILDTFPYPGGTTTCEALWMGVPTLALAGDSMLSCQGAALLASAGLAGWTAVDGDAYVAKALAFAGDLPALAALRSGLRARVAASPLFDAARFARHLEQALLALPA
ncbi:MAG: tetratricopeptide repeat protein [Pseudomonadota bacterium]